MANREQWMKAIEEAKGIKDKLKDKIIRVVNYVEEEQSPRIHYCKVIQVNPRESFENEDVFEFYALLADIDNNNLFQHAFPLEKIIKLTK